MRMRAAFAVRPRSLSCAAQAPAWLPSIPGAQRFHPPDARRVSDLAARTCAPAGETTTSTGPAGPVILSVFAAIWAIIGLDAIAAPRALWLAPAAISAGAIAAALAASRARPRPPEAESRRIGRLVGLWSAVEGVAIFAAINLCINLHRPGLVTAAISLVVGLHFFPLAHGLPVRLYYVSGAAITVLAGLGLVAGGSVGPAAVAFGTALILWATLARLLLSRAAP